MKLGYVLTVLLLIGWSTQERRNVASLANGGKCIHQVSRFPAGEHAHCNGALDDRTDALYAQSNGYWGTYKLGIGASMTVQFAKEYTIDRIRLMQRWWQITLVKCIDLEFSDITIQQV